MNEVFGYRAVVQTDICVFCQKTFPVRGMVETGPVYRTIHTEEGTVQIETSEQYHACAPCADEAAALDHADYVNGNWDRRDIEDEYGFYA